MNYNHPAHAYQLQPQQFAQDQWLQNQLDQQTQFNGGYVRNPTAGTIPRIVGYPDSRIAWNQNWSV